MMRSVNNIEELSAFRTTHEQSSPTEIAAYLSANHTSELSDLQWWKWHARDYPSLANQAKNYLSMPLTSSAVERAFPSAGLTISEKRTRFLDCKRKQLTILKVNQQ